MTSPPSFYVTLPSNSSAQYYPNNTAGHYLPKLPQPVELSGEYEVGLSEIHISQIYGDVNKDVLEFTYREPNALPDAHYNADEDDKSTWTRHRMKVPRGNYQDKETFIADLNKLAEHLSEQYPDQRKRVLFSYNERLEKAIVELPLMYGELHLSSSLAKLLGMSISTLLGPKIFYAEEDVILNPDYRSVFIYCDIVTPRAVGDYMVPLLRTMPPKKIKRDNVHLIYEKPHYIPVSRSTINTVELFITNDYGKEIIFREGHTIITLHFRRRRFDY